MPIAALLTAVFLIQSAPPAESPSFGTASAATKADEGKLLGLLGDKLVDTRGKTVDTKTTLDGSKVIALYFSAGWCPPCKKFTPKLVNFVKQNKDTSDFTVIFVSSDRSAKEFADYMKHYKMPFPAMSFDKAQLKKIKRAYGASGIPNLVLLKPDGTIIKGSYETNGTYSPKTRGSYIGPDAVLKELSKLVKKDEKKAA